MEDQDSPLSASANTDAGEYSVSLPREISIGTRPYHTHLNRLIVSRLPKALPPSTESSLLYATGLLHFASIYETFETEWHALTEKELVEELSLESAVTLSSLIHILIPALSRSDRLKQDLRLLLNSDDVAERIQEPSTIRVQEFVTHIRHVAVHKPHALIAYAWVLYMALFNGGRWIRGQLLDARNSTWELEVDVDKSKAQTKELGLAFWHFDGLYDGEDHMEEFKDRLADVESMLGIEQRKDIVIEAREIFKYCALLVEELDEVVSGMQKPQTNGLATAFASLFNFLRCLIPLGFLKLIIPFVRSFTDRAVLPIAPPPETKECGKKSKED